MTTVLPIATTTPDGLVMEPAAEDVVPEPVIVYQHRFFVPNAEGGERATLTVERRHGMLFIRDLFVHPDYRDAGYATDLLTRAITELGHEPLALFAAPYADRPFDENELAAWYARFGFLPSEDFPGGMIRFADDEEESDDEG